MQKQKAKAVAQRRRLNEIDLGWELNLRDMVFRFLEIEFVNTSHIQTSTARTGRTVGGVPVSPKFISF